MSLIPNRPNSALLVIDVQNNVVAGAWQRDQVIANINLLVEKARATGIPVVWIQHADDELIRDSEGWQYVPELQPADDEALVHKHHGDAFEDTDLEETLAQLGVGRLLVSGAQTDACIRSTLHGAFVRGYDTLLVADAHTTEDLSKYGLPAPDLVVAHTNAYWRWQTAPGREAGVVNAAEVQFQKQK